MDLKEAKKILRALPGRCKQCESEEYCDGCYIDSEDIQAISTILKELDNLQKENEQLRTEVNSLQKENDEIKNVSKEIILETGKIISILQDLLKEE